MAYRDADFDYKHPILSMCLTACAYVTLGMVLGMVMALIIGTVIWLVWPVAVPSVLPTLVAQGYVPAQLSWWTSVCVALLCSALFKSTNMSTSKRRDD